jgi:hypothetical protein
MADVHRGRALVSQTYRLSKAQARRRYREGLATSDGALGGHCTVIRADDAGTRIIAVARQLKPHGDDR